MGDTVRLALEGIAYLANEADTVESRRELDVLLRSTDTFVEFKPENAEVQAV